VGQKYLEGGGVKRSLRKQKYTKYNKETSAQNRKKIDPLVRADTP